MDRADKDMFAECFVTSPAHRPFVTGDGPIPLLHIATPGIDVKKTDKDGLDGFIDMIEAKFGTKTTTPCTHWEGNVYLESVEDDVDSKCAPDVFNVNMTEPGSDVLKARAAGVSVMKNTSYWKALRGGECISVGLHRDIFVKPKAVKDGDFAEWLCYKREIAHLWTKERGYIEYK